MVTSGLDSARADPDEGSATAGAAAVWVDAQTGLSAAGACKGGWWRECRGCVGEVTWW